MTLVRLMNQHRHDAKNAPTEVVKRFHWDMAFDYLGLLRKHYGGQKNGSE